MSAPFELCHHVLFANKREQVNVRKNVRKFCTLFRLNVCYTTRLLQFRRETLDFAVWLYWEYISSFYFLGNKLVKDIYKNYRGIFFSYVAPKGEFS